ncbi:MAG TPA: class I SAM-dependent methyltransferase [Gaiellaceae bacterium]
MTTSTPEMWAANFAASRKMTAARRLRIRMRPEWRLLRRTFAPGSAILDAGCGFGEWVNVLETGGFEAIGVDYSAELINRLRSTYPGSRWLQSDVRSIPLPDHAVDGVISWGVIEHDEAGPEAALREFCRIVKPRGAIVVSVPRDSHVMRESSQKQFPVQAHGVFFQYFMTEAELASHVARAGFEIVETGTIAEGSLPLFAPAFYLRASGLALRVANLAASILLKPIQKYHGMIYCIGHKP